MRICLVLQIGHIIMRYVRGGGLRTHEGLMSGPFPHAKIITTNIWYSKGRKELTNWKYVSVNVLVVSRKDLLLRRE